MEKIIVIVAGVLSLVSTGYSWITWRSRANTKKIESLEGRVESIEGDVMSRLDDHNEQLTARERKNLSDMRKDLGEVHDRITDMGESVSEIKGQTNSMAKTLNMINEFLLQQGSGR